MNVNMSRQAKMAVKNFGAIKQPDPKSGSELYPNDFHYDSQKSPVARQMDSKVLGRVVEIVLDRRHPNAMIFDGVPYTMDEMRKLKGLDRDSLIAAHNIKRAFQGKAQ